MDDDLPVPTPIVHDGDDSTSASQFDSQVGSQFEGSQFSEKNPLTTADPSSFKDLGDPKKPQAVAFHGWQRTVAVDEDFDPTIPVRLGAPGTGLSQAKVPPNGGAALGPALGRGKPQNLSPHTASFGGTGAAPELWDDLQVTQEDKKEAKSLRALPVAPGAAPLPFPRVVSESDESSVADSLDSLAQRQLDRRFETQSSSASSDLSFLVNTAAGNIFGTRPTFGRAIEPRIPATVGEERLHNSLAQYFGHSSRRMQSSGDHLSLSTSQDKERSERGTVSSTPVTKAETRESSLSDDFSTKVASSINNVTAGANGNANGNVGSDADQEAGQGARRGDGGRAGGGARKSAAGSGSCASSRGATKRSSSAASTDQSLEDVLYEEGRLAKPQGGEGEQIEPGQRMPLCGCFRTWPWKILMGFVMFVAVVAVVVVINSGGSLDAGRRLALLPNGTLVSDASGWGAEAALKHSNRVLKHADMADDRARGVFEGGRQPSRSPEGGNTSRRRRGLRLRSSDIDKSRQVI